jgi:hypothetical protein
MVSFIAIPMLLAFHLTYHPNSHLINKKITTLKIRKITREQELKEFQDLSKFMNNTNKYKLD